MATVKELKAELKAKGIKGITGKKKAELEAMLAKAGGEKSENDAFFEDAYKKLGKTPKPKKSKTDMGTFLKNAEKKIKTPYVAKLPKLTKQISVPKEKVSMNLQEELAKAGLRGGMKKKFKV
jgi:hypothetical protein